MMGIEGIKQVYLVGIGGIGMSGLARYFNKQGWFVSGFDKTETTLTKQLSAEGILISYQDDPAFIPAEVKDLTTPTLVIYTPAVSSDSNILAFFRAQGHALHKRAEVLGLLSKSKFTIAVAGTHGKTTTSSLIAHILTDSGFHCTAFLGGIASNYDTNMLISDSQLLVVEADEYDRSFLTLHPDIAIVTSTDADHLDIYDNRDNLLESFQLFVNQTTEKGTRIIRKGLTLPADIYYAQGESADAYSSVSKIINGAFYFDYHHEDVVIPNIHLGIPGNHNIENAVAAITAARILGVSVDNIRQALSNFKGVKRRFEYIVKTETHVYIDDYAHHPAELNAFFSAAKSLYPDRKVTAIFQPHLFSRTRDFADEFAEALSLVDELILMPIYPAREQPIAGITSEWLLEKIGIENKRVLNQEEITAYIEQERPELVLTVGAGDIDRLVGPLKEILVYA